MSLKIPPGSKSIEIEWLDEQIIILTSITQLRKIKKWNDMPDSVVHDDDWHLYSGRVITAVRFKRRFFFLLLEIPRASIIAHESVHLAHYILKHHGMKSKGEVLAYMVEHIFDKITKCLKIKEIK